MEGGRLDGLYHSAYEEVSVKFSPQYSLNLSLPRMPRVQKLPRTAQA